MVLPQKPQFRHYSIFFLIFPSCQKYSTRRFCVLFSFWHNWVNIDDDDMSSVNWIVTRPYLRFGTSAVVAKMVEPVLCDKTYIQSQCHCGDYSLVQRLLSLPSSFSGRRLLFHGINVYGRRVITTSKTEGAVHWKWLEGGAVFVFNGFHYSLKPLSCKVTLFGSYFFFFFFKSFLVRFSIICD